MNRSKFIYKKKYGFSLLEAIIILVVASLVLSVILPLASRTIRDNLRIGVAGLRSVDESLSEDVLRRLGGAVITPIVASGRPPAVTTAEGSDRRLRITVLPDRDLPCAAAFHEQIIELRLESAGASGRLICVPITGLEELEVRSDVVSVEIFRWRGGFASFQYSENGQAWSKNWPLPHRRVSLEDDIQRVFASDEIIGLLPVSSPRLRFVVDRLRGQDVSWLIGLGEPAAVVVDPLNTLGLTPPRDPTAINLSE